MVHGLRGSSKNGPKSSAYKDLREQIYPDFNNNAYLKADGYSSETKYLCLINQDEHKVYVFKGQKGSWKLKKKFTCSVGAPSTPTPMGVFKMYGKNRSEPMNYFDSGTCRCFYYSPFYQSYYFHSVLYYQDPTPQRVMDGTLGANVSHGCVRLALDNAKWIYKYVPNKTTVVSYNRKF
jgi:lipoprotein-anchoring transpeptidase ErfK/SrfK